MIFETDIRTVAKISPSNFIFAFLHRVLAFDDALKGGANAGRDCGFVS